MLPFSTSRGCILLCVIIRVKETKVYIRLFYTHYDATQSASMGRHPQSAMVPAAFEFSKVYTSVCGMKKDGNMTISFCNFCFLHICYDATHSLTLVTRNRFLVAFGCITGVHHRVRLMGLKLTEIAKSIPSRKRCQFSNLFVINITIN